MIKFFRKIRQKLLSENKFSKYLIYAIGEIVLVVIGILIALSINNWNENNKTIKSENKALVDLKKEFTVNMNELSRIQTNRVRNDSLLRDYLNQITNSDIDIKDKIKLNIPGVYGAQWSTKSAVLTGIINSGGLDKFQNDSLKILISNWTILVNKWEKRESYLHPIVQNQREYLSNKSFRGIPKKGEFWNNYFPNHNKSQIIAQRRNFVNKLEFHNHIANLIGELWIQQSIYNEIELEYNKLMRLLDKEMKSRNL